MTELEHLRLSQAMGGRSSEINLDRIKKSSRKPRRISNSWTFRPTESASKCCKLAVSIISLPKATILGNKKKACFENKSRDFSDHVKSVLLKSLEKSTQTIQKTRFVS